MGKPTLEGVDLKLNRAADHFDSFMKAASEFMRDEDSCTLGVEEHPQGPGLVLRVEEITSPPSELSLLIGECVHQYRSALDHLAFQLVVGNSSGRIPERVARRCEFPIFNSGPKFRGKVNRKGVPSAGSGRAKVQDIAIQGQRIIESLQPYHRRKNPRSRSLWHLQELSNIDKHRLLHVTQSAMRGSGSNVFKGRNIGDVLGPGFIPGPMKRKAVIASFKIVPIDPRYGVQAHLNCEPLRDIAFGKGSLARSVRGASVATTLYEIGAFIASDVVPPLADLLGLSSSFRPGKLIDAFELSPDEREVFGGVAHELGVTSPVTSR